MLFSLCSTEIDENYAAVETSTTTTIAATTTTTTLLPSQERAKEINIDRTPRRGVIRTNPNKYISTIYKCLPKKFIFPKLRVFYFKLAVWFYRFKDKFNI